MLRIGIAALAIASSFAFWTPAGAWQCPNGTSCSQAEKDKVDGICCPAKAKPPPPPPPTSIGRPPPIPPAVKICTDGRVLSDNTCCWPGQRGIGDRCRGIPSCPTGFRASGEDCVALECSGGRVRPPRFTARCCWPGQDWSPADSRCIGIPSQCPSGTEPSGEDCVTDDRDGDGVKNRADRCVNDAEDRDTFEDTDGCPDPDNDRDGVLDAKDSCPLVAEDQNGLEDDDGCPDEAKRNSDDDADGLARHSDKCPDSAEDKDGVQDDDGCPEEDADGDSIRDGSDKCPDAAEDTNGLKDDDGCPDQAQKSRYDAAMSNWNSEKSSRESERDGAMFWVWSGGLVMTGGAAMLIGQHFVRQSVYDGGFATASDIESDVGIADLLRFFGATFAAGGGLVHVVGAGIVFANMGPYKPDLDDQDSAGTPPPVQVDFDLGLSGAQLRVTF